MLMVIMMLLLLMMILVETEEVVVVAVICGCLGDVGGEINHAHGHNECLGLKQRL